MAFRPSITLRTMRWKVLPVLVLGMMMLPMAAGAEGINSARVLDSHAVDLGDRIVTYQRIEAPELLPQPEPTPRPPAVEPVLTAEELEEQRQWQARRYLGLLLSCITYGGQITEVHLHHEGQEVRIHSNVDFNNLSQFTEFVTDEVCYILILGVGDLAKEDFRDPWPHRLLNTDRAAWQAVSGNPSPELIQALGDLHRYYDANKEVLMAQRAERAIAVAAREQWLRDNPPQPQDTVIQFFPIRSSRYSGGGATSHALSASPR